ncbi:MAG: valine--tRNA ligase [Deltaproteobacteria bacterium]|nr:valine--tRNA ligase [Deltaproteobacteria bacterium]
MGLRKLEKVFDAHKVEDKWYEYWIKNDLFAAHDQSPKKAYSIVIPPPNVTGTLHIGHALNNTLQDILIRLKRMQGYNALWMPGMDHAGIATQNIVEKKLAEEGITRHAIGREEFIKRVWEWKEKYGGIIINQLKKLGASCDWKRQRFTMDEGLSKAVIEVFVRLYNEGLIYQGNYIINWCPRCQTALSDLEVEHEPTKGNLFYLKYPFEDKTGFVIVATTRPETMLGDIAVAVHPDDPRYKDKIGKTLLLPVIGRKIPLIADEYVDMEFGTGALKITPAHDPNDFLIGQKHDLEVVQVIDESGIMNENAAKYKGLDRFECRRKIIEDFKKDGTLVKIEDYEHNIGHCYRCKTIIEPYLSKQWFIKIKPLAEPAIKAVKEGRTRIIPHQWERVYFEWMENIRDWCISRQIWWGHRIPVWYCEDCGETIVQRNEPSKCPKCGSTNLKQEDDVLDTWFSSALWPFSTLGWPEETLALKTFYPTSVLVTGFDILFFWVARMMMMGIKFMGDVPFRDVYIHALVKDLQGQKMSKTRGNVIDPLVMMEKYGTDAFRFALSVFTVQGRDIILSEERISGYRNFANKIWNAARFSIMNLEGFDFPAESEMEKPDLFDRWIMHQLNNTVEEVISSLDEYRFNEAAQSIYQFFWHEFCDWYLELIKPHLYKPSSLKRKRRAQNTLLQTLITAIKLLHPFMPFITEEIYQSLPGTEGSIVVASFPKPKKESEDYQAYKDMTVIKEAINSIRNIRGEMDIHPSKYIDVFIYPKDDNALKILSEHELWIKELSKVEKISYLKEEEEPKKCAAAIGDRVNIFVLLEGVVDLDKEKKRLMKEISNIDTDLSFVKKKLSNKNFIEKAPREIVEKEKRKKEKLTEKREKIYKQLERIQRIEFA